MHTAFLEISTFHGRENDEQNYLHDSKQQGESYGMARKEQWTGKDVNQCSPRTKCAFRLYVVI